MYMRLYCPIHKRLLKIKTRYCSKCKKEYNVDEALAFRSITLQANISESVLKQLNDYCERESKFRHLVVEQAIEQYLKTKDKSGISSLRDA